VFSGIAGLSSSRKPPPSPGRSSTPAISAPNAASGDEFWKGLESRLMSLSQAQMLIVSPEDAADLGDLRTFTRDHVRRTEFTVDDVDELLADEGANSGVGKGLQIVAIDRTLPTTRPHERLIGTKFDSLDLEQELRNLERWIER